MSIFVTSAASYRDVPFAFAYELAGKRLYSQTRVALIDDFAVANIDDMPAVMLPYLVYQVDDAHCLYRGEGSFSGGMQTVAMYQHEQQFFLELAGQPFAVIDVATLHIHLLSERGADDAWCAEILLGPPLLLLLAMCGIFCLHAGAVATEQGVAVFIGESGRGKSTLSTTAEAQQWQRLGDDILPISLDIKRGLLAHPRFPQLKRSKQYLADIALPVSAIFALAEPNDSLDIAALPLTGQQSLLMLARHTAASRVFDNYLLSANMQFNLRLAKVVEMYVLHYPRDFSLLGNVRECVISKL